jgi:hypothetical protein
MDTKDIITIIASSTLLSASLSTLFTFFTNRYFKKVDFKNEYFKKVIDKRIEVYELIEFQIELLKTSPL